FQVQLDLRHGALDAVAIEPGKDPDQGTPLQDAPLPAGGLRVTDLGYFDTEVLRRLDAEGGFWSARLPCHTWLANAQGAGGAGPGRGPDGHDGHGEAGPALVAAAGDGGATLVARGVCLGRAPLQPPSSRGDDPRVHQRLGPSARQPRRTGPGDRADWTGP